MSQNRQKNSPEEKGAPARAPHGVMLPSYIECPHCLHQMDRTTGMTGREMPRPGDVSLCIRCAGIALFDERLQIRAPDEAERLELEAEPAVTRTQALIRRARG